MLKKIIVKSLITVFVLSSLLTVKTYAGENDIPRMFQRVIPITQMK